jgi:dTDP-4-amino-4,6-dideoxygalactose transaminase
MKTQGKVQLLVPDSATTDELLPYLRRIDASRWYSNFGPLVLELEAKLLGQFRPDAQGLLHLTTVSNCTVGLELALWALGLRPGSRVLMPALTFVATAAAVVRAGYQPVLSDVDPESWLLTPAIAKTAIAAAQVDAVMPVSTYGCAQDGGAWDEFSQSTGVPVVVDAAGSFGNQHAGDETTLVFSLHATKSLSAAEGGFVISGDQKLIARVRRMSNFGIDFSNGLVETPGTNAKLSEYHAAVALATMDRWSERKERRVQLHGQYIEELKRTGANVTLQQRPVDGVYSIMPVLLPAGRSASRLAGVLHGQGVETRRWYCPAIHHQPGFAGAARAGELKTVESLNERLLALPFHPFLTVQDIRFVCERLKQALE